MHHKLSLSGEEMYFTNTDIGKGDPPDSKLKQIRIRQITIILVQVLELSAV